MTLRALPPRLKPANQARASFAKTEGGKNAAHYQTDEHRKWRLAVVTRDGFTCVKCGATGYGVRLIADHVFEIEDGGAPLDPDNGQTLCLPCANSKTALARRARLGQPQGEGGANL